MYDSEVELAFVIDVIDKEIEFAKSQLQPHDTGHIHTAISWMTQRKQELEETYNSMARSSIG